MKVTISGVEITLNETETAVFKAFENANAETVSKLFNLILGAVSGGYNNSQMSPDNPSGPLVNEIGLKNFTNFESEISFAVTTYIIEKGKFAG